MTQTLDLSRLDAEAWVWPPNYDDSYRPEPDDPYWFRCRETMAAGDRERLILRRIQQLMRYAWENAPFYRRVWDEAGVHPDSIRSLEDFERVPVVTKQQLRESQAAHEPFGDYACVPDLEVKHVHGTSGTTGRPTAFGFNQRDWRSIANAQARVMWGMGLRPADTVFVGSLFSLYMGSWGALIGSERLGAGVFPFGAGVPGQTLRAVNWLRQMRPTAFYGTPSYALRVAEIAKEQGIDPREFGLRIMFFSGEPGASVPSVRALLQELFGAQIRDSGSMAEVSPWMNLGESTASNGPLLWQDIVYTEVVDPQSLSRVPYGGEGTPVYTTLERTSQPMIRLVSGDLTRWEDGPSECGRTYPSLPKGIYGRIDDMLVVRGENIYPSAIDDVLTATAGYGGEHRVIVSRKETMDELTVQVESEPNVANSELEAWKSAVAERLRTVLGVKARVVHAEPGSLERTDLKARRVIDDRVLLHELTAGRADGQR
jgi:phenylacetate-CoA ligase